MKFSRFEVVKSDAGHDKNKIYLISQIVDEDYVMLIDGKSRKILNPKKKKIKHISSLNVVIKELEVTFDDKSKINDGEIRKILKKVQKNS